MKILVTGASGQLGYDVALIDGIPLLLTTAAQNIYQSRWQKLFQRG